MILRAGGKHYAARLGQLKPAVGLLLILLPWALRRRALLWLWGYQLHPTSRIGLSLIYPKHLAMGPGSHIGHFAVCRGVDRVELGAHSQIGNWNWITRESAYHTQLFADEHDRASELRLGEYAVLTSRHYVDCTNVVSIGEATVVAGIRTAIFSHSISIRGGRQRSKPVTIGKYCFVATNCVILPGATLPDFSVLNPLSRLQDAFDETYMRYDGAPAQPVEKYTPDAAYFVREV